MECTYFVWFTEGYKQREQNIVAINFILESVAIQK